MNKQRSSAGLSALLLALAAAGSLADSPQDPNELKVMLQGGPAEELATLVRDAGGKVTHKLPIIDAVGASVTRDQLDQLITSPLVQRHIDDLARTDDSPEEPEDPAEACYVAGALDLEMGPDGLNWRLYKREDETVALSELTMTWPAVLGEISALSVAGKDMTDRQLRMQEAGGITLSFNADAAPKVTEHTQLTASFSKKVPDVFWENVEQRDFGIVISISEDCKTELIPGYRDNHNNSYFPTVVGADALHQHGITGRGVTVAVLDSGLWETGEIANNTAGEPRIVGRYDAIKDLEGESVFDASGHGTHMTSIVAHSGPVLIDNKPTGSFKGIAPDVSLVAVKAFDDAGQGEFLDIARGVQWVVDNKERYNIRVLNLSFAALPRWPYWLDPVNQAVMRAWAAGITVVAAAGNDGPEPMTIGSPGNLPYVITVGAVTDSWTLDTRDDDYIPDFSAQGPTPDAHLKPDIVAPGGHISGITRPGSSLTEELPQYLLKTGEFVMTGTSQASALVSGIVALLLQIDPELSPDDVKCMLTSSAEPAINADGRLAYSPFQQGHGYVSATRAITLGQRGCGNTDLDLAAEIAGTEHFQGPAIVDSAGQVSLPGLDSMLSGEAPEKGLSATRKWGIKEHIERLPTGENNPTQSGDSPFDWAGMYLEEAAAIEALANDPTPMEAPKP